MPWRSIPNVLCWEFGNEMEGWADSPDEVKFPWHREMADYLRSIDPFEHLITTSFWSKTGPEQYWDLDNIDIVQTHCYTNDDGNTAEAVRGYCLHQWKRFAKPHIFGEFGIRSHSTTADKDPQGWALWIQNRESSWYNHARDAVSPVDGFRLGVALPDGRYEVERWETWKGRPLQAEPNESRDGVLELAFPELESDVALKIRKP